ncbi:RagB/SusD family nutrient uptake outer membrane protein, partial [Phocaeicola vulgatus]
YKRQKLKSIIEMKLTKNEDGTITYKRNVVNRVWDDKMYLFPIPQSERMKNPNLSQNAGW